MSVEFASADHTKGGLSDAALHLCGDLQGRELHRSAEAQQISGVRGLGPGTASGTSEAGRKKYVSWI
jgi:hypothetical protein